jgi:prepilin-type N-terminal cleavage/methylation domain-containing protein
MRSSLSENRCLGPSYRRRSERAPISWSSLVGPRRPDGFSLVELAVVMAILAVVIALLLPAIQASRESSRRAQCSHNQQEIAAALLQVESRQKHFPGYANALVTGHNRVLGITFAINTSWPTLLFRALGRKDIEDAWLAAIRAKPGGGPIVGPSPFLSVLVCPSDPPNGPVSNTPWLSYVVNRGRNGWNDNPAVGIFFDQTFSANGLQRAFVTLDFIQSHDGAADTLLLAESPLTPISVTPTEQPASGPCLRLQGPSGWAPPGADGAIVPVDPVYYYRPKSMWLGGEPAGQPEWPAPVAELSLGFEWSALATRTDAKVSDQIGSRHPGVIMASFCDGHQMPLAETMDVNVFKHLMTPDGAAYQGRDAPPGILQETVP